ncbi:MAG: aminopeptidase P family protein [Rikenellaceae bacterium]
MGNIINQRIASLREVLADSGITAIIIPSNDPHFGEYVPSYYKCREYISGFNGSAGTAVVSTYGSALWTDSRYFLQAEDQLSESEVELIKMGYETTPTFAQWLKKSLKAGEKVAVDAKLFSVSEFERLKLSLGEIELTTIDDPFTKIWNDRPLPPSIPIFTLDITTTGEGVQDKIKRVKATLDFKENEAYIVTATDEVAWLCNIRGGDVDFNPVAMAYAIIENDTTTLFIDINKVDEQVSVSLSRRGINIEEYSDFENYIDSISHKTFIVNGEKSNLSSFLKIKNSRFEKGATVVSHLKSVKNETELEGFKRAMIEDGKALVKFYIWLEEALNGGGTTSEWEVNCKLKEFRGESQLFVGESFGSIVGYNEHGAVVHYGVTPKSSKTITKDGMLLIDSGGQYLCGTTDITRTIHLSTPTKEQQKDFTLVLMGNINLASAIFPTGTRGSQLDILARKSLNQHGINYMHGTGHGIGHFLNVHEGPQSIRKEENSVTIKEGMVMSNEPAMYRTGQYGIRTENVIVVIKDKSTEFGDFLKFETITLFPIDLKCIDLGLLTPKKRNWLNSYHKMVYDTLSSHLTTKEQLWLAQKTKSI